MISFKSNSLLLALFLFAIFAGQTLSSQDLFPDGTPIPDWFRDISETDISKFGKQYKVTDFGVKTDSTLIQTKELQAIIDLVAVKGGVVIIPKGVFLSGALFFKQNTHLYLEEGGVLKGSDDI